MPRSRRRMLAGLSAATALLLAGCPADPAAESTPANDGGDEDGNASSDGPATPGESAYGVSVEPVGEAELAARFDVGGLDEQPVAVRNAVRTALADRYETQAVGDDLARFVTRNEFARVGGTYVELDAAFPEEVLTVEAVDADAVDDSNVVGPGTFREDPETTDAIARAIAEDEARRYAFPTTLHTLVDEYAYVSLRDPSDAVLVYAWTIERDVRGGPPYTLAAREVSTSAVFGDAVVDFSALSPASQAEFEAALADGRQSSADAPALLDDEIPQYVRYEGTIYRVAIDVAN